MGSLETKPFNIVGISVRTTNENMQMGIDIPTLWNKFMAGNIAGKISNKIDNSIYCIYTEYEKDYTKPYTVLLGYRVDSLDSIPQGLVGMKFEGGTHNRYVAKGNLFEGAVFKEWQHIWGLGLKRAYTYDFEVYGEKALNPIDAEVEIFIAV